MSVSFDETNLVPNAGLLPAAVLAQRIGLAGLVDSRLKLARHGANSGAKAVSVIGSMLAGGDSIDDVGVLRAGAAGSLFDGTRAPSTVGSWLRSHKWSKSGSWTQSAASCWRGCGRPAPDRPTLRGR